MSVPGTEQFNEYKKALGLVEKQLRETETQAKLTESGFCKMAETTANTFLSIRGAVYAVGNLVRPFMLLIRSKIQCFESNSQTHPENKRGQPMPPSKSLFYSHSHPTALFHAPSH